MGIKFYKKNIYDIDYINIATTVVDLVAVNDGAESLNFLRNRNNTSGWSTTGSTDAANTTIEISFVDARQYDTIILLGHNLKSYTVKYWDDVNLIWVDFSTVIDITDNATSTTYYEVDTVISSKVQIIIRGTMVVDDDKFIRQLLFVESIGEYTIEPYIRPEIGRNRKTTEYLSGKSYVTKSIGGFKCGLTFESAYQSYDLTLTETLFDLPDGFLVWLCGGDIAQYETVRFGYRLEDIFLMAPTNEYKPEWNDGRYANGMTIDIKLVEVN